LGGKCFSFQVGNLQCMAVSDGTHTYVDPASVLFAGAPQDDLETVMREYGLDLDEWKYWRSSYTCLVVNTREQLVLMDTGAGKTLDQDSGKLQENLESAGISPCAVDVVIITHAHPDHIGGNTAGDGRSAFPNASYVISREEWEFWTSDRAGEVVGELDIDEHIKEVLVDSARRNLYAIREQIQLIDAGTEIASGIRATAAPGHTPGHMVPVIDSEGEQLFYVSDAVIHPIHVQQPHWYAAVDCVPQQAVATRRRFLGRAADAGALVLGFHFPFPGLGRVTEMDESWRWRPVV